MKKIYLSLLSLSVVCGVNAQTINKQTYPSAGKSTTLLSSEKVKPSATHKPKGATLWSDDFSTPSNWTFNNTSAPAIDWSITTDASLIPVSALAPAAFTSVGNGYALIDSDSQGGTATQNCNMTLTVPFSTLGSPNVSIVFENSYRTYLDTRIVRVSNDGGTTWVDYTVTDGTETTGINTTNPKMTSLNISATAGNQAAVLLQFNYQAAWGWYWAVDDIQVVETDDYDLELQDIVWGVDGPWGVRLPYYQIPTTQVQPIYFGGKTQNIGVNAQSDAVFTATIASASYVGTSPAYSLAAAQIDTLIATETFTPAGTVANFSVASAVSSAINGSSEVSTGNNSLPAMSFDVTSGVYARDKGTMNSGTYNQGLAFEAGNIYDVFANDDLYAVDVQLSANCVPDALIFGTFYEIDPSTGDFINPVLTADYIVASTDPGTVVTLRFDAPIALVGGNSYLITVGSQGGPGDDLIIGTSGTSLPQTTFYKDETATWFYSTSTSMVRMNFTDDSGVKEIENTFGLTVYPNPAVAEANISFNLKNEATVSITVTDLAGKVVYANNLGGKSAGAHKVSMNTEAISTGVYMVNVIANGVASTQKLVIRK
jgi:hypothetical protein